MLWRTFKVKSNQEEQKTLWASTLSKRGKDWYASTQ